MPKEDPFVNRAQLLKAIKKYPEIWDSNNKLHMCRSVTAPLWNEIAEQFGGHVPTVKLQSIWSQMKYHYHNLVHRQILHKERFTTKWEHFEPMSFMYNITVAKIVGTATAAANGDGSPTTTTATTTVTPPPPPPPPPPSTPTPTSAQSQPLTSTAPLTAPPLLTSTTITTPTTTPVVSHHQGRGRPSGSFTAWLPPVAHHHAQQQQQQLAHQHQQQQHHQQLLANRSSIGESTMYTGFSGLVPPPAMTIETTTTSTPPTPIRKPGRPGSLNNSMRGRIIDSIKSHPVLWAGRQREPQPRTTGQNSSQNRTSAVWKEIAAELGLTPSLLQTRWSIIKQRYVDELQKERHSQYTQQNFHSSWEHFDRMGFMREILTKKVDEREQTREHIQEIVSEQQLQQQQQQQQQQHHHQHQQQHQHHQQQQQQHHQQQQHSHLLRYNGRPPTLHHTSMMMSGLTGMPGVVPPIGLVNAAATGHPLATLCDDMNVPSGGGVPGIGPGVDVSSMLPMHLTGGIGRRRVKTESDLEWDPFEMILQVHGTEPAAN